MIHLKTFINCLQSLYTSVGSNQSHQVMVEITFKEEKKKKLGKSKKSKDNVSLVITKKVTKPFHLPHWLGEELKVWNLDQLQEYLSKDSSVISYEDCLKTVITKKDLVDYLVMTKKELSICKPFSRKLNSLGLMPSMQMGTLVENSEELAKAQEKLRKTNVKKWKTTKNSIILPVGMTSIPTSSLDENISNYLSWILESISLREIQEIRLSTFNNSLTIYQM